jgi:hypothetical protein
VEGSERPHGYASTEHCIKVDEASIRGTSGINSSYLHIIKLFETNTP